MAKKKQIWKENGSISSNELQNGKRAASSSMADRSGRGDGYCHNREGESITSILVEHSTGYSNKQHRQQQSNRNRIEARYNCSVHCVRTRSRCWYRCHVSVKMCTFLFWKCKCFPFLFRTLAPHSTALHRTVCVCVCLINVHTKRARQLLRKQNRAKKKVVIEFQLFAMSEEKYVKYSPY